MLHAPDNIGVESNDTSRRAGSTHIWIGLGLAAAAVIAVLGWALLREDETPAPAQAPATRSPPVGVPAAVAEPASATAAPVEASTAIEETQLCGGVWVKTAAEGVSVEDTEDYKRHLLAAAAREQTLAAMDAGDELARAAAHFYRFNLGRVFATCRDSMPCNPGEIQSQAAEADRTALIQMAQTTADPDVYALAYRACDSAASSPESACYLITPEQWARLDPSNAIPWMYVAEQAERRGEASAVGDAMFHIAGATRDEWRWGSLPALLIAHAPRADAQLLGVVDLAIEALGIDAAQPFPFLPAMAYCRTKELVDTNRRETCDGIAKLFAERSGTLVERSLGIRMAKRLGWPPEQIRPLEEERDAMFATYSLRPPPEVEATNCKSLRRALDRFREVGTLGDVGVARRAMAASKSTVPQLADEYRRWQLEAREKEGESQAAASSASAAERFEN